MYNFCGSNVANELKEQKHYVIIVMQIVILNPESLADVTVHNTHLFCDCIVLLWYYNNQCDGFVYESLGRQCKIMYIDRDVTM